MHTNTATALKKVTVSVPIGKKPPAIGQTIVSEWFDEETYLVVKSIDSLDWKIYDDIKELMVTLTGEVIGIKYKEKECSFFMQSQNVDVELEKSFIEVMNETCKRTNIN